MSRQKTDTKGSVTVPAKMEEKTYEITEAAQYVGEQLGIRVSVRTFRTWVQGGHIPFARNPGPLGHHFWTKPMLDEIVQMMRARIFRPQTGANRAASS